MATVKTNTDVFEKACLASYKRTTHHMMVMKASLQDQLNAH